MTVDAWWDASATAFVAKTKCEHCCERPVVKTPCQAANVCAPIHTPRTYTSISWTTWFKYAAYSVLGVGAVLGSYTCYTKYSDRRRVQDDKDNWEGESEEEDDARNRENSDC